MFDRKNSDSSEFWLADLQTVPIAPIVTSQTKLSFKCGIGIILSARVPLK